MSFYLSLVLLLHQDQVCYHPYTNGIPSNSYSLTPAERAEYKEWQSVRKSNDSSVSSNDSSRSEEATVQSKVTPVGVLQEVGRYVVRKPHHPASLDKECSVNQTLRLVSAASQPHLDRTSQIGKQECDGHTTSLRTMTVNL